MRELYPVVICPARIERINHDLGVKKEYREKNRYYPYFLRFLPTWFCDSCSGRRKNDPRGVYVKSIPTQRGPSLYRTPNPIVNWPSELHGPHEVALNVRTRQQTTRKKGHRHHQTTLRTITAPWRLSRAAEQTHALTRAHTGQRAL